MHNEHLIELLSMSVFKDEACAHALAEMAQELDRAGCGNSAWKLLELSRNHQVKAIEARARLAALNDEHAGTVGDDA